MLKKFSLLLLFIFATNFNVDACCDGETIDDRNNSDLAYNIAGKIAFKKISSEDLSKYIQTLHSFIFIFERAGINVKNVADVLATKILHSHKSTHLPTASYTDPISVGTVYIDILIKHIKDVRKTVNLPNVESKCVIL